MVENQRQRIAAGMIAEVVERGYAAATVTQVVAAAGVSRRTFYNNYSDKQEAFFDVYRQVTEFLIDTMVEAGRSAKARGWAVKARTELAALLEVFAANPDLARFTLAVPPAAGGEVAAAYRDFLARLITVLSVGRPKRARRPPPASEYGIAGGLAALVLDAAGRHEGDDPRQLLSEVTELVLTPYLGREEAAHHALHG